MSTSVEPVQKIYFEHLAAGRFVIQRCTQCQQHTFYPRLFCPHCDAGRLEWVDPVGAGTVYSHSIVRRKPEAGGDYGVALIDLDEGVRMMSCLVGIDLSDIRIGLRVRAKVESSPSCTRVVFTPLEEERNDR